MLLLRSHYDNEDLATLSLADGDVAATMLRPRTWNYAFVALLYPFYIESGIQLIYVQLNVNDSPSFYASAGHYEPQTYYVG